MKNCQKLFYSFIYTNLTIKLHFAEKVLITEKIKVTPFIYTPVLVRSISDLGLSWQHHHVPKLHWEPSDLYTQLSKIFIKFRPKIKWTLDDLLIRTSRKQKRKQWILLLLYTRLYSCGHSFGHLFYFRTILLTFLWIFLWTLWIFFFHLLMFLMSCAVTTHFFVLMYLSLVSSCFCSQNISMSGCQSVYEPKWSCWTKLLHVYSIPPFRLLHFYAVEPVNQQ